MRRDDMWLTVMLLFVVWLFVIGFACALCGANGDDVAMERWRREQEAWMEVHR